MKGKIFQIERFAVYDGDGIRTVVFFKGCPLRCLWCHNPEGLVSSTQVMYQREKCVSCGKCVDVCKHGAHRLGGQQGAVHEYQKEKCVACGECIPYCFSHALVQTGEETDAQTVAQKVLADVPFYGKTGGVTLSGGEPTMQADFAAEILSLCKKSGVTTCVETCGYCQEEEMQKIAEYVDCFLFDIKETDEELHKRFTGVGREKILKNLRLLGRLQKRIVLRMPIIPDLNMREDHFKNVARLAEEIETVVAVELEPYHPIGLSKYAELGLQPKYTNAEFLDASRLKEYANAMRKITQKPVRLSTGENV